jgi:hypothetical protein
MAQGRYRTALTGGGSTALDGIDVADLSDGTVALVFNGGTFYWYRFDATATAAESSPDVIRPHDYSTAGNWELQQGQAAVLGTMPAGVELQGGIVGLDCSPDTDTDHDVLVAIGACMDSTGASAIKLSTAMTKRIDASWTAGDDQGGLLNGSVAANTIYHFYALLKDSDSSVDFGWLADGDTLATYLPAGYSKYRWLRFHKTDASSNICGTTQAGDFVNHHKSSDWVVSSGLTTSYATVDHSGFIPGSRISLIKYGTRGPSSTSVVASDDGTNLSVYVGHTYQNDSNATGNDAWWHSGYGSMPLMPYYASRQFKGSAGGEDLLIHSIKLKR